MAPRKTQTQTTSQAEAINEINERLVATCKKLADRQVEAANEHAMQQTAAGSAETVHEFRTRLAATREELDREFEALKASCVERLEVTRDTVLKRIAKLDRRLQKEVGRSRGSARQQGPGPEGEQTLPAEQGARQGDVDAEQVVEGPRAAVGGIQVQPQSPREPRESPRGIPQCFDIAQEDGLEGQRPHGQGAGLPGAAEQPAPTPGADGEGRLAGDADALRCPGQDDGKESEESEGLEQLFGFGYDWSALRPSQDFWTADLCMEASEGQAPQSEHCSMWLRGLPPRTRVEVRVIAQLPTDEAGCFMEVKGATIT